MDRVVAGSFKTTRYETGNQKRNQRWKNFRPPFLFNGDSLICAGNFSYTSSQPNPTINVNQPISKLMILMILRTF